MNQETPTNTDSARRSESRFEVSEDQMGFLERLLVWICLKVRRCFRDFVASMTSQVDSFSA
jgi:hypothetical protein